MLRFRSIPQSTAIYSQPSNPGEWPLVRGKTEVDRHSIFSVATDDEAEKEGGEEAPSTQQTATQEQGEGVGCDTFDLKNCGGQFGTFLGSSINVGGHMENVGGFPGNRVEHNKNFGGHSLNVGGHQKNVGDLNGNDAEHTRNFGGHPVKHWWLG